MVKLDINNYFEDYLKKDGLFVDKKVLQSNYTPDNIPHREKEIKEIASMLAPALKSEKPSNLFLYGKTGTGKTLSVLHVSNKLNKLAKEKNIPLSIFYLNCKLKRIADTEYRLIATLARKFGKEVPITGLPTDEIYRIFVESIDDKKQNIILVLDEIDQLVKNSKSGDEILYNLTRMNSELKNTQLSFIGISNDLRFANELDPRVKSSLTEENINFPSYNALQLQDILNERSKNAFKKEVIEPGVVEKCAALAAREHGDARRALDLLRVAGEIAERKNSEKVMIKHIDEAEEKIEKDLILDTITTLPKQTQFVLLATFNLYEKEKSKIFTGDVYNLYRRLSQDSGLKPLTQRRMSDLIGELDMLGIINAKVISKGRYGRTREINMTIPDVDIPNLKEDLKKCMNL